MKGALAHALKTDLTNDDRERLLAYALTLPDATADPIGTADLVESRDGG